jgi:general secretion pathway protein E
MAQYLLVPSEPGGVGDPVPLGAQSVSIGRHPGNTLPLNDDRVSRYHCVIESDGQGGFLVRDLGSRNGTKLNDLKVSSAPIGAGDVLRVGKTEFFVEAGEATESPAPRRVKKAPRRKRNEARGTETPGWIAQLHETLKSLPPKDEAGERIGLIDASGHSSEALGSESAGPRALRLLLQIASKARATDIHLESKGPDSLARMRVDGQMVTLAELPKQTGSLVGGVVKTVCQMQQAAPNAVQEGHFSTTFPDRRVDYRVSFTPSVHGQKLVIRVLDSRGVPSALGELGLISYMHDRLRRITEQSQGLLLVCGPTGSGKTTTLYNALREIDRESKNVVTIEDPVEYQLDNVTQIPIDTHKGNTFGSLLRSVLRQDPDVILVGEIRDDETARTAMQAAMTGHVVYSTVHAKDTVSAIFRLLDLGVESYLVANSLDVVLAQRLVRVLCNHCKRPIPVSPGQATRMGRFLSNRRELQSATGCARCLRTGYWGRRAIFELLDFNDDLRDIVLTEPSIQAMKKTIDQGLFTTLMQYGWTLAAKGITSLDEVERVAG